MRILQVHTRYRQSGGEDTAVAVERQLLAAAGHVVESMEFRNPTDTISAATGLVKAPWNRTAAREVVAGARRFGADVVHVHNTWFALSPAVFPALAAMGMPSVVTVHNYRFTCVNALLYRDGAVCRDCLGRPPWPGVLHACYRDSRLQSAAVAVTIATQRRRRVWNDVDVVIALTDFAAGLLADAGIPSARILVRPNTVADPGPRPAPPSASSAVLYVGRLTEEKGILDLLEGWSRADTGDLQLLIAGDGPLRAAVERHPSISAYLGSRPAEEIHSLMASSRALVLPSRWFEGFPMVLVEAASHGLPVVAPQLGALGDLVGPGGWIYESGNKNSLIEVLETIRSGDVDSRGVAARSNYEALFSPRAGLIALEEAYARAQRGRRA